MRSIRFLSLSLCLIMTGCCSARHYPITDFPPTPKLEELIYGPLLQYNAVNSTYIVTKSFVKNTALEHTYLEEIQKWRRDNGIR